MKRLRGYYVCGALNSPYLLQHLTRILELVNLAYTTCRLLVTVTNTTAVTQYHCTLIRTLLKERTGELALLRMPMQPPRSSPTPSLAYAFV